MDIRRQTHWLVYWVQNGVVHAEWYECAQDARRAVADARYAKIAAWIESQPTKEGA